MLELAPGTGRTIIPIAKARIDITGMDISRRMLGLCRSKLKKETEETQSRVTLLEGDMRNFNLMKTFPLVSIPYASFTYLTEVDDQLACLRTVCRHLEPGGIFFMTVFNESVEALADRSVFKEFDITPQFVMPDGRQVYRRFRYVERDCTRQVEVKDSNGNTVALAQALAYHRGEKKMEESDG